ncbi:unnamed protein product [Parascedosporium putredinis]|uniref:Succinate dehydrogenase cytochrome b560 subunit n=1 Tax=Parascedosporium putredinis TaxID=1442378 RepID=A0A9P1H365_9PEZI|nr:unnamed protein product [Parascedosporium putredinis]CAI7994889.1 unnamed protein product [Parascedosporium putredinis]
MIAQRVGLSALRRGGAIRPNVSFAQNMPKVAVAAGLSTSTPSRASSAPSPPSPDLPPRADLVRRLYLDPYHRRCLAGALYGYSIVYLASPLLGWHIESSALVEAFAGLGAFSKGAIKSVVAWPFVYHLFNGIRHLTYDMAWGFSKPVISKVATAITATSTVVALGLGFLW